MALLAKSTVYCTVLYEPCNNYDTLPISRHPTSLHDSDRDHLPKADDRGSNRNPACGPEHNQSRSNLSACSILTLSDDLQVGTVCNSRFLLHVANVHQHALNVDQLRHNQSTRRAYTASFSGCTCLARYMLRTVEATPLISLRPPT